MVEVTYMRTWYQAICLFLSLHFCALGESDTKSVHVESRDACGRSMCLSRPCNSTDALTSEKVCMGACRKVHEVSEGWVKHRIGKKRKLAHLFKLTQKVQPACYFICCKVGECTRLRTMHFWTMWYIYMLQIYLFKLSFPLIVSHCLCLLHVHIPSLHQDCCIFLK
jgi:hypothetical protein